MILKRAETYKFGENWVGSMKPEWFHYFLGGWKDILKGLNLLPKDTNLLLSGKFQITY